MSKKRVMLIGLDGADPAVVKRLVAEGRMPNMAKLIEQGAAREGLDMMGVLPTITPPNWATLATGNYPRTHGVTCFLNHTLGKSLGITELNWDSRRIESELIWEAFEDENKKCIMLNYCEAWPPRQENTNNIFIDGTGVVPFLRSSVQFQKIVHVKSEYTSVRDVPHVVSQSSNDCIVFNDQVEEFSKQETAKPADMPAEMSKDDLLAAMSGGHFAADMPLESPGFVIKGLSAEEAVNDDSTDRLFSPIKDADGWSFAIPEGAKEAVVTMNNNLHRRYALFTGEGYDTLTLYRSKRDDRPLGQVKVGEWSAPIFDTFNINDNDVRVAYYLRNMDMNEDGTEGHFYISHVMNTQDDKYCQPKSVLPELMEAVGPMCYFATVNRHTELGDRMELESFDMINDWHMRATEYLLDSNPDWQLFYIHLHSIDLVNHHFIEFATPGRDPENWEYNRDLIDWCYEINDKYLGTVLKYMDENTTVAVVSDHAAIPRSEGCENPGIGELSGINAGVMEDLGYTVTLPVPGIEGMYQIDWTKTRAINHRTSHIYINLKGRDPEGIVEPEDYDDLVQQIISDLYNYRDPKTGKRVVAFAMTREEMETIGMGGEHCGDIFFQLTKDFGMEHGNSLQYVTNEGYSLACLCVLSGGGIKKGEVIKRPIRNVDIVPTFCHLADNRMPHEVEGGIIYQALE
ncbi:alkaline phosphatase family protein [Curtanaerobium respiraculi]|uniref:alkaline phosphatase family protein n=1 Tax=Curtanaerobium respiraculi TaxID=2949669 RepID=UPI0024B34DD8|nr:alkaline phosphatase family protein [Curtanaerobium respiraculi]